MKPLLVPKYISLAYVRRHCSIIDKFEMHFFLAVAQTTKHKRIKRIIDDLG
jgi:hypothetical protein